MIAKLRSCSLQGVNSFPIDVEVSVSRGALPSYQVVGLPDVAIKEGCARIQTALKHIGHPLPPQKIVVNLAPADRKKDGAFLDLPIALAILMAQGLIPKDSFEGSMVMGELGLDGVIKDFKGGLHAAIVAHQHGLKSCFLPPKSAEDAAEMGELPAFPIQHLTQAIAWARNQEDISESSARSTILREPTDCMSEVVGQTFAKFAIELAVIGGHNLLLTGPPGVGKSMLAKRIPSLLPPLTKSEALELTEIHASAGTHVRGLLQERPFRSPHHSITIPALVGGGSPPRPGEISLAHHGVLFLDELPEFQRQTLESLRQPLENKEVHISRAKGSIVLPASFLLIAAANPCPCGYLDSRIRECVCSPRQLRKYQNRLSGPLLDRIDIRAFVSQTPYLQLQAKDSQEESSESIRFRALETKAFQIERSKTNHPPLNAHLKPNDIQKTCALDSAASQCLQSLCEKTPTLSTRGVHKIIRIARTIADMNKETQINRKSLLLASKLRHAERI